MNEQLPQPYPSWVLNEAGEWTAPIEKPDNNDSYLWNESRLMWVGSNSEYWEETVNVD